MQDYETLELKYTQYEKGDEQGRYDYYTGIIWVDDQSTVPEQIKERYVKHVVNKELVYINGVLCYIYDVSGVRWVLNDKNKPFHENAENGSSHIFIEYHEITGPNWDNAPRWANFLMQCPCTGNYVWYEKEPSVLLYNSNYNSNNFSCSRIAQFGFQYPIEQWKNEIWMNPKGIKD